MFSSTLEEDKDREEPASSTCQGEEDKQGEEEMEQEEMDLEMASHHLQPSPATATGALTEFTGHAHPSTITADIS